MKTVNARRFSEACEFVIIVLLILSPFLPWFWDYPNGEWASFCRLFTTDAIDAIGNLTYDHMTFSTVLQVGYLQSALMGLIFLMCTWGYGIIRLGKMIFSFQTKWGIENFLLWGSLLCLVGFAVDYRNLGWGYWLNGGILIGIAGWQSWQYLRQRESSGLPLFLE